MKKITSVFLLLLCTIGTTLQGHAAPRTKLVFLVFSMNNAFKKCYTPYMKRVFATSTEGEVPPIPSIQRGGDFKDLVTRSTIFADKSMFIKDVIEDASTSILIAMPRRWGKSVNLDMLRRFLEIPVGNDGEVIDEARRKETDNYQIFAGGAVDMGMRGKVELPSLKVANADLFGNVNALEVQGTTPVIYIDFKNCKSNNYKNVKALLRAELSRAFRSHSYLKDSSMLTQRQRELVDQYIEEKTDSPIIRGLQVLSDALYTHHNKKVWILVDEYDAVANVAYREFSEEDLGKTIDLFSGIYETALKGNPNLEKGVLTGVQYIAQSGMLSGLNHLIKYDFTAPQYAQHYGLDQTEVDHFFNHFGVPTECQESAKKWYNGYKVPRCHRSRSEQQVSKVIEKYNVWSIVNYLLDGRGNNDFNMFQSYWEESGSINTLKGFDDLLKESNVRKSIEQLLNGEYISFDRRRVFSAKDFGILKTVLGGNKKITKEGRDVLFSYLFTAGYLTLSEKNQDCYVLPNREIKYEIGKQLITCYETIYKIDPGKIQYVTDELQRLLDVNENSRTNLPALLQNFYDQFREVIQSIPFVGDKEAEGVFINEDIIHSILNSIALQTNSKTMASELYTKKKDTGKGGYVDLAVTTKHTGMIIEVKCDASKQEQSIKDALKQAENYQPALETTNKIFLAVNVVKEEEVIQPDQRKIQLLCKAEILGQEQTVKINAAGKLGDQHMAIN